MASNGARSPANGHLVPDSVGVDKPLSKQQEFINAKSFLLQSSTDSGVNLYDHLAKVLTKILSERPENVPDVFENISKELKKTKYMPDKDTLRDKSDVSTEVALAEVQRNLYKVAADDEVDDTVETPLPNLWKLVYFFEQANIGLGREELYRVWLALKQLVDTHPLQKVRFWGKVLGTEQNYYVAEVEYREGELEPEEEEEDEAAAADKEPEKENETDGEAEEEDKPPKPTWKAPPEILKEENGVGTNKKVFFVCNDPGKPWIRLPSASPAQIQVARKIRKFFTGRLDAPVICYPPFGGNEAQYLRAQIARISAGTQIAPQGFYTQDEGEEEEAEAEGGARDSFVENPEYQPIPVKELADAGMSSWVHIAQHILPQGRCVWWNPAQKAEDEFEGGEEDEEEKEEPDEPQKEEGPPLLTPCSEDVALDGTQPWTGRVSSKLIPQYAIAVVDSNLWPGAHAFSFEKSFENVYIGWGLKYSPTNFQPDLPPPPMEEYPSGPEITEIEDPTPEEEAALRAQQQQNEEGGEEEGEEAEEEQEDDD